MVHVDNSHTILVRQAPEGAPVYRLLRPWPELTITPANARPVLQESEHALQACPQPSTEASFAHAAKINALMALGRLAEAREAEAAVPLELIER